MAPEATSATCFPLSTSSAICSTSEASRPSAMVPSSRVTTDVPTLTTTRLPGRDGAAGKVGGLLH
eukprot:scaffold11448_cov90-Isochrysis_galbana.AAC.1